MIQTKIKVPKKGKQIRLDTKMKRNKSEGELKELKEKFMGQFYLEGGLDQIWEWVEQELKRVKENGEKIGQDRIMNIINGERQVRHNAIIRLYKMGYTMRAIGKKMGISCATVHYHIHLRD